MTNNERSAPNIFSFGHLKYVKSHLSNKCNVRRLHSMTPFEREAIGNLSLLKHPMLKFKIISHNVAY